MLGRLQRAQTHSARARFHRNVAPVQLSAWVAARMAAMAADEDSRNDAQRQTLPLSPDNNDDNNNNNNNNRNGAQQRALPTPPPTATTATPTDSTMTTTTMTTADTETMTTTTGADMADKARQATEKARFTAVLNALVEHDLQRRSRDAWQRECAAGRYWTALVTRFGAGVVLVKPRLMGMTTKGFVSYFLGFLFLSLLPFLLFSTSLSQPLSIISSLCPRHYQCLLLPARHFPIVFLSQRASSIAASSPPPPTSAYHRQLIKFSYRQIFF
jgi:hypothetical protein